MLDIPRRVDKSPIATANRSRKTSRLHARDWLSDAARFFDAHGPRFGPGKIDARRKRGRKLKFPTTSFCVTTQSRRAAVRDRAGLTAAEKDELKEAQGVIVRPIYLRMYPNGSLAGHVIGYTGKTGRTPDGFIENHEVLWPETEGREGLEQTFNDMLSGQHGEYKLTFDKDGRKTSEKIAAPPVPGYNVVTTSISSCSNGGEGSGKKAKRGAIVIAIATAATFWSSFLADFNRIY